MIIRTTLSKCQESQRSKRLASTTKTILHLSRSMSQVIGLSIIQAIWKGVRVETTEKVAGLFP